MSFVFASREIQPWLQARLGAYCDQPAERFSPTNRLVDVGFTSVYALALCGDVEDEFALFLEPSAFSECRTVGELAQVLEQRVYAGASL